MKIERDWLDAAGGTLQELGIVNGQGQFPKEYKGYISSFGAMIVQSGLLPTLLLYESGGKDDAVAKERARLVAAIKAILLKKKIIEDSKKSLAEIYVNNEVRGLLYYVEKAAVALKLSIRMYDPVQNYVFTVKFDGDTLPKTNNKKTDKETNKVVDNNYANAGWLFYRHNYREVKNTLKNNADRAEALSLLSSKLQNANNVLLKSCCSDSLLSINRRIGQELVDSGFEKLTFQTVYPGLLVGLGVNHGVPVDGDFKVGFQFDYTSGLPVIPGSSIKGMIESMFPTDDKTEEECKARCSYIKRLLNEQGIKCSHDCDVLELAKNIFKHEGAGFDIFMDGLMTGIAENQRYYLGDDYITPHKNEFSDPVPIQIIKVLPGVEFTFWFKTSVFKINDQRVDKLKLFKRILLDIGIGAKTNVGYGRLKLVTQSSNRLF